MKRLIHQVLILSFFTIRCYADNSENNHIEKNPGILLNPQDVSIFYDNHPLKRIQAFTVITSSPFEDNKIQKTIENAIQDKLKIEGDVIHLKDNDMRGFGSGTILLIQIGNAQSWNGNNLTVSRISLSIETSVVLNQTGTKTFPIVWNINTFLDGSLDSISEDSLVKGIEQLINDFLQNYRYANKDLLIKPIFYTYN